MINLNDYKGANVLVTGSAGFVGRHLCARLRELGAWVSRFDVRGAVGESGDVRHPYDCMIAVKDARPDFVFHLAAQAFVPKGYEDPAGTWETNVQGTVNLLDALRWEASLSTAKPCSIVVVTTDKVYGDTGAALGAISFASEAQISRHATETDPLNGLCPYSASKVAAERVVESYRTSYDMRIATARAGNIIGPGDHFGVGRLVPNAIEALRAGKPVPVYNPTAVRPWQYVKDVVEGYLLLGLALTQGHTHPNGLWGYLPLAFASAFNFGPEEHHTVQEVVDAVIRAWGSGTSAIVASELREVQHLRIDSSKARRMLGWVQGYSFEEMIRETVEAYKREEREIAELAP